MAGEIIQNIDLRWDSKSAEHSLSDFGKNIEKHFNRMHFDPLKQFDKDLDKAKKNVEELTDIIEKNKGKTLKIGINDAEIEKIEQQLDLFRKKADAFTEANDGKVLSEEEDKVWKTLLDNIEKCEAKLNELNDTNVFTEDLFENTEQFKSLTGELEHQQNIVDALENSYDSMIGSMSMQEVETSIKSVNAKMDELDNKLNQYGKRDLVVDTDVIKEMEEALADLERKKAEILSSNELSLEFNHENLEKTLEELTSLEEKIAAVKNMMEKAKSVRWDESITYENIINEYNELVDVVDKLNERKEELERGEVKTQKAVTKTINVYKMLGDTVKRVFSVMGSHSSKGLNLTQVLRYALGIRSLYTLFNRLKSAAKEGLGYVANYSAPLKASLNSITSSFTMLKAAVGAAVAPLVQALAPAISRIAQLFVTAANAVARFFGALTGRKTVVQATLNQNAFNKAVGGSGKAAKDAAKDIKQSLAPFDDLNVLAQDTADSLDDMSGAGAGDGFNYGDMFEEAPVDNWLKDMWEKGDFTELGRVVGENIRDTLNSIDWDGTVKPMARKIAKSIATAINGFINVEGLGQSIGHTLAQALNTASEYLLEFSSTLDWGGAGRFISDILNSLFGEWDAGLAMEAINKWLHGLLQMLTTALLNTNWEELGFKIGEFFGRFDWVSIFAEVVGLIVVAIESLGELVLGGLLGFITGLLENIKEALGEDNPLSDFLQTIIDGLTKLKDWFTSDSSEVTGGLAELAEGFKVALEGIIGLGAAVGLWSLINHLKGVKTASGEAKSPLKELADTASASKSPWDNLTKGVGAFFDKLGTAAIIGSVAVLLGSLAEVISSITDLVQTMNDTNTSALEIFGLLLAILVPLGLAIGALVAFIPPTAAITLLAIGAAIDLIATGISKLVDSITNLITTPAQKIKELIDLLEQKGKSTVTKIKDISDQYRKTAGEIDADTKALKEALNGYFKEISESVEKYITGTGDSSIKTLFDNFKNWINDTFFKTIEDRFPIFENNFRAMLNNLIGYLQHFADAAASAADAVAESINNLSIDIPAWVPKYGGNSWHPDVSGGVRVSLPRLATGAVLPPNQPFLAMLGDQKKGTNIEAPLDTIVEAMQQALGNMNYNGGQEVVLNIDGTTLARLTIPNTLSELNRQGYNVRVLEGNKYGSR